MEQKALATVTTVAAATTAATAPNEIVTTISLVITIVCGLRTIWLWFYPHVKKLIESIKAKRLDKVNETLRNFADSLDSVVPVSKEEERKK